MITGAKRLISKAIAPFLKAAGTHVYRPVINGEKWAAWATEAGVPNAKTADEMKVSVLHILGEFKLVPNDDVHTFRTEACVFGIFGGKLVAIWYDYGYYDRHWTLREVVGYDSCVSCRAMLVLSDEPGDFMFTDDQLRMAPRNIVLDGELSEPMDAGTATIVKSAPKEHVTPTDAERAAAKTALATLSGQEEIADPSVMARLYEISKGCPMNVTEAVAELGDELAAEIGLAKGAPAKKTAPVTTTDTRKTADVSPSREIQVVKRDTSRRTVFGWASVATVDGETYTDLHGDTIEVDALHDICELVVMEGNNLGGVEHVDTPNVISAAMVIDDDWAAAMSDNFFFDEQGVLKTKKQGLFMGYHFRDADDWDAAGDKPIEFSINGTAFVAVEQESA